MKTRQECIFGATKAVREDIAAICQSCGRDVAEVAIVGAAKTFPAADVRHIAECGVRDIGENYVQEARGKMTECRGLPVVWHYLGRLQSNKAAQVARLFDYVHSVDSAALAAKLSAARAPLGKPLAIFVQVNIDGEVGKGGASPKAAASLAKDIAAMPHLVVKGLMCMPNPAGSAGEAFAALRRLRDSINDMLKLQMDGLSMGMSGDYKQAIAEGATHLRLGTALFGARPTKAAAG
ncbi:MAG: YggS family pyridoxal phosphate-dependent enzyme [Gammaproteobacteria bacterium]